MSRTTLRIVILLGAISIAGVIVTQIYWVKRAYGLRETQFSRDAGNALRSVAEHIFKINKTPSPSNNPVRQIATNSFVVSVNGPVEYKLLNFLLRTEFEKRNITSDFEYCVYDCVDKCIANGSGGALVNATSSKPADGYYFVVQFPRFEAGIISQMGFWGFSSFVLLLVVCFFVYALLVILKQRRLSEIQKDFINNMTHEFKTPISTIAISAGVLKEPGIAAHPDRLLSYATIIENENKRLRQHVERVLQVASLDQSDIGLKLEQVDIHNVIRDVVNNITVALQERHGRINLDLKASPGLLRADPLHMMNVFFNLLDNAIKYTTRSPEIDICTYCENDEVRIEISDNGNGISPENQRKVFDRFYRIPTGNIHDVKGFGLGLNYVRLIIKAHHGKINLTSIIQKGSTFSISLPLQ